MCSAPISTDVYRSIYKLHQLPDCPSGSNRGLAASAGAPEPGARVPTATNSSFQQIVGLPIPRTFVPTLAPAAAGWSHQIARCRCGGWGTGHPNFTIPTFWGCTPKCGHQPAASAVTSPPRRSRSGILPLCGEIVTGHSRRELVDCVDVLQDVTQALCRMLRRH